MRFLTGFTFAAMMLGLLLIVTWCVATAVAVLGGPDTNPPGDLVSTGAKMLVIGGAIYVLLKSQQKPKTGNRSESGSA
jgi:hypothetical protein